MEGMERYRAKLLHKSSCRTSKWSGGLTTELAIAPEGSAYGDRNFLWRISSATVDDEESIFTSLPGYDRIILALKGGIRLSHNGGDWIELQEYEPYSFDGADETKSAGRVTDFNLMMRKGKYNGSIRVLRLEKARFPSELQENPEPEEKMADTLFFYCAEGRAAVTAEGKEYTLDAGDSLLLGQVQEKEPNQIQMGRIKPALDMKSAGEDGTKTVVVAVFLTKNQGA